MSMKNCICNSNPRKIVYIASFVWGVGRSYISLMMECFIGSLEAIEFFNVKRKSCTTPTCLKPLASKVVVNASIFEGT